MKAILSLSILAGLSLTPGLGHACGAAFGTNYRIEPEQKIVVSYHDGVESYIFNPRFCGAARSFGLILPIPDLLAENPVLTEARLYSDLDALAAPNIVTQQVCAGRTSGAGGGWAGGGGGRGGLPNDGTTVVERGQVGIFDWALLRATSVASFTDWLTQNQFPYPSSALSAFDYYVNQKWYFVAFKVSASGDGEGAGGSGGQNSGSAGIGKTAGSTSAGAGGASSPTLCGNFGPVLLAFPVAANPVVPARIASVSSTSFSWDIFTIAPEQRRIEGLSSSLRFSGPIAATELEKYASLRELAQPGDHLTEYLIGAAPSTDIDLAPDPTLADFRRTEYRTEYITCTGGSANTGGAAGADSAGRGSGASAGQFARGGVGSGGELARGGAGSGGELVRGGSGSGGELARGGSGGAAGGQSARGGTAWNYDPEQDDGNEGCSIQRAPRQAGSQAALGAFALTALLLMRRRRSRTKE